MSPMKGEILELKLRSKFALQITANYTYDVLFPRTSKSELTVW